MDKSAIQSYTEWAKIELTKAVEQKAFEYGITENEISSDNTIVNGKVLSQVEQRQRLKLVSEIKEKGYKNVIEEVTYTWFNRFIALRFMEVNGYLPSHVRVFSDETGKFNPQIIKESLNIELENIDRNKIASYIEKNETEALYKYLIIAQCNDLNKVIPSLFEKIQNYTELLFPNNILANGGILYRLVNDIKEDDWKEQVQIIGWIYQFYVASDRQKFRDAKIVKKDLIPTLTQIFTPDWIVRYMAENSVGRIWLESYPNSPLRAEMKYYVDDAKQDEETLKKLEEIKYKNVNPEEIRIIEPCCGSGHILVYVFDLLYKMYEEKGYQTRDIPTMILQNNLTGLEIDKRAAQIASFSLVMQARSYNSRFFNEKFYVEPRIYELIDSLPLINMDYYNKLKDLNVLSTRQLYDIQWLVNTFEYAKTIGSLIRVEKKDFTAIKESLDLLKDKVTGNLFTGDLLQEGLRLLYRLLRQARVMARKYDVMITNPPYLGISKIEQAGKQYLSTGYPGSKSDMFAMFMEAPYVKRNGFIAMVNPDSWMFLSSYDELRNKIVNTQAIINMIHLGMGDFDATVHTTSFVIRNVQIDINGTFFRLNNELDKEKALVEKQVNPYIKPISTFKLIPADILGYWLTPQFIRIFKEGVSLNSIAEPRQGLATADNNRFLRLWHEVNIRKVIFNAKEPKDVYQNNYKWVPYNKGGALRKWYGDNDFLINWENNGKELKEFKGSVIRNPLCYFKPSVTWSKIGTKKTSFRYKPNGFIFDVAGTSVFADEHTEKYLIALLNSVVIEKVLEFMSPSLNFEVGHIAKQPVIIEKQDFVENISNENIAICKEEWDDFEDSWDFKKHPLINKGLLEETYNEWVTRSKERFNTLKSNEELLNKTFIEIYKLESEINPKISDEDIYIRLADKEREIKSLISYIIGLNLGRYSLDVEGLAYAGGNLDLSKYKTIIPDKDNIIPICDDEYFEDDLCNLVIESIKKISGEDTLEENLSFIAEALGGKGSSREVLRNYLLNDFYKDHLKIYQKRPIYWLFDSGKKNGFKALIYMHRYTPDLLAKMRTDYVHEQQERYRTQIANINTELLHLDGVNKVKAEKKLAKINDQLKEINTFEEKIHHLADQMISIDLDDGVKVNYAKFGEILAQIK